MVQPIKTKRIDEFKVMLQDAKSIVLNDFTGLNVSDISELRRICRQNDVIYRVVKNTLAKRSFRDLGLEEIEDLLEGPTAVAISTEDEALPAQIIKKFAEDYEFPRFKGGYVAGRLFSAEEIERLASLPGREVLLGQVVGTFQAPMRGLLRCLTASLRDLVCVLNAISEKKGAA